MVWLGISLCVVLAIIFFVWREELTYYQAAAMGARMPVGCAVIEAVLFLLLALGFFVAHRAGIGPY